MLLQVYDRTIFTATPRQLYISYVTISWSMMNFIVWGTGVAWYMLPWWAADPVARAHSLSGVRRWLAQAARHPRSVQASSCCSYIVPVARNIDRNIGQAAGTVLASADSPEDTNNPSVGHIRMRTALLRLSPVVEKRKQPMIIFACTCDSIVYLKNVKHICIYLYIFIYNICKVLANTGYKR